MSYDRTTVQIRERSFLDLLDLALMVIRRWPLRLAAAAAAGIVPFVAFNAWLEHTDVFREAYATSLLLPWFEAPLATAPLTIVLGGLMFGERASARRTIRSFAQAWWPLLLYQFFLRGLLMIILLGYLFIPSRLVFLNEVILLERGRWREVPGRASKLVGNQGAELFFQWLAQLLFGGLFVACFWIGTSVLWNSLIDTELTWDEPGMSDLRGLPFLLAYWTAIAFFAVSRFLTYIDQRTRLEGWEVELRLRAVGRNMEEARSW